MTVEKLIERAKNLGLPIAKNSFAGTLDNPVPSLPYLVYLISHEKVRGPDGINMLKEQELSIELYTADDDREREELAERIETEILHDVEYDTYLAPIPQEECYQTSYEVSGLITKIERKNKDE